MRLIDAGHMKETIEKVVKAQKGNENDHILVKDLYEFINAEPTAYDVDKVMEQLEAAGLWIALGENDTKMVCDILKAGGVNE